MIKKSSLKGYANKIKEGISFTERKVVARVAGVTFEGRQEKLNHVSLKTPVQLERDRRNEYDFYAVKVMAEIEGSWEHIGFLPAAMSKRISKSLDSGMQLEAKVYKVKGGFVSESSNETLNRGLDILITGMID